MPRASKDLNKLPLIKQHKPSSLFAKVKIPSGRTEQVNDENILANKSLKKSLVMSRSSKGFGYASKGLRRNRFMTKSTLQKYFIESTQKVPIVSDQHNLCFVDLGLKHSKSQNIQKYPQMKIFESNQKDNIIFSKKISDSFGKKKKYKNMTKKQSEKLFQEIFIEPKIRKLMSLKGRSNHLPHQPDSRLVKGKEICRRKMFGKSLNKNKVEYIRKTYSLFKKTKKNKKREGLDSLVQSVIIENQDPALDLRENLLGNEQSNRFPNFENSEIVSSKQEDDRLELMNPRFERIKKNLELEHQSLGESFKPVSSKLKMKLCYWNSHTSKANQPTTSKYGLFRKNAGILGNLKQADQKFEQFKKKMSSRKK